jgi:predicted kinase
MRGIPGVGKSYYVRKISKWVVCSADDFFIGDDGEYRFDPAMLKQAHDACLMLFFTSLQEAKDDDVIVVDNTNIRVYEFAPYYRLAEAFGVPVEIVWVHCDPAKAAARTTHGVPSNKVLEMAQSFEAVPPWWNVRHVFN